MLHGRGRGGGRGGLVAVAAGLVAGELGVAEGGEPVQGVSDGAGGPGQDPADRVRGELGVRVGREVGLDEVAQLPGAGCRAGRAAWPASGRGGLEQAAGLGGGGADGVHPGQRGSGVPAVQRLPGRRCLPGDLAQQLRRLARRRGLLLAVRRGRGSGFPGRGVSGAVTERAWVRRGVPAGRAAVRGGVPAGRGAVCRGGLVRAGDAGAGAGGGVGAGRAAAGLVRCRAGREAAVAGCGGGLLSGPAPPAGGAWPGLAGAVADAAGGMGCQVAGAVVRPVRAPGVRVARPLVSRAASSRPAAIRVVPAGGGDLGGGRAGCGGQRGPGGRCRAVGRGCGIGAGGGDAAVCGALCAPLACAVFFFLAAIT